MTFTKPSIESRLDESRADEASETESGRFVYSLRTLMVVITLFAATLAVIAPIWNNGRWNREMRMRVAYAGGDVWYDATDYFTHEDYLRSRWFADLFHNDYFGTIRGLDFVRQRSRKLDQKLLDQLPYLTSLSFRNQPLPPYVATALRSNDRIERLRLFDTTCSPEDAENLACIPNLKSVAIYNVQGHKELLLALARQRANRLEVMHVAFFEIDQEELESLAEMTSLRFLRILRCPPKNVAAWPKWQTPRIEHFQFIGMELTPEQWKLVTFPAQIGRLDLTDSNIPEDVIDRVLADHRIDHVILSANLYSPDAQARIQIAEGCEVTFYRASWEK